MKKLYSKEVFMKKIEQSKKLEDLRRKNDKKKNNRCFPPNKEKIEDYAIIFIVPFILEEFDNLKTGLKRLFAESPDKIDFEEILTNSKNSLMQGDVINLPYIINKNGGFFPSAVILDLGQNIQSIQMVFSHLLPSTVILQVNIFLNPIISKKITESIYKQHETKITYHDYDDARQTEYQMTITSESSPQSVKQKEIEGIINEIKNEVITFLTQYFNDNYFLKLFGKTPKAIPCVDLFVLKFPNDDKKLNNWLSKSHGFLDCLGAEDYECFRYDEYLLFRENWSNLFNNIIIFTNEDLIDKDVQFNFDFRPLFDLFAIWRWLKIQEQSVGRFNLIISKEFEEQVDLDDAIKRRQEIYQKVYLFERLKSEFEINDFFYEGTGFISMKTDKSNFHENLLKSVQMKIEDIEKLINTYYKHSNLILNLKNMKYGKEMNEKVKFLTYVVIALAIIQIIIATFTLIIPYYFPTS